MTAWILAWLLALGSAAAQTPDDDDSGAAANDDDSAGDDDSAPAVAPEPTPPPTPTPGREERRRRKSIQELSREAADLEATCAGYELLIERLEGPAREALERDLIGFERQLAEKRSRLAELVAGRAPEELDVSATPDADWNDEVQQLLAPLVAQLKHATQRPRELEQLRAEVVVLESREEQAKLAFAATVEALDRLRPEDEQYESQRSELIVLKRSWQAVSKELGRERQARLGRLHKLEQTQMGIEEALVGLYRVAFGGRTRTMAWSLLAILFTLACARLVHFLLVRRQPEEGDGVSMRLTVLGVYAAGLALGLVGGLGVIYASGDWLLFALAVFGLFVGLMALRNSLTVFWLQIRLLLNIGEVRQGERLLWEGVPWRVQRLAPQTILVNPAFPGTFLRVPARSLLEVSSRPLAETEDWFPTRVGDWVLWDHIAAEVAHQGPETVRLNWDRSALSVPTAEFLAASPRNLSSGFRHRVVLTLDYRHQAIATTEVPHRLRGYIAEAIQACGAGEELLAIDVAFEAASASSLDIEAEVDFDGSAANRWEALAETIQAAVVDACNAEGWEIALPQLTLHQAQASEGSAGAMANPVNP